MSESDLKTALPTDFPSGNYGFDLGAVPSYLHICQSYILPSAKTVVQKVCALPVGGNRGVLRFLFRHVALGIAWR